MIKKIIIFIFLGYCFFLGKVIAHATQFCVGVDNNGTSQAWGEGQNVAFSNNLTANCSFNDDNDLQNYLINNPTPEMQLQQGIANQTVDNLTSSDAISSSQAATIKNFMVNGT